MKASVTATLTLKFLSSLRAAPCAGRLDRLAALVENAHVRDRAAGGAVGPAHPCAARTDCGEIVAHAAAAAHGLRRFHERDVDARLAVHRFGDRVAHRLHETVDERRGKRRSSSGIDAAPGDEAALEGFVEHRLPARRVLLDRDQRTRDPPAHVLDVALIALRVLLEQDVERDLLRRQSKTAVVELHAVAAAMRENRRRSNDQIIHPPGPIKFRRFTPHYVDKKQDFRLW
jgi:hypothetical protein